MSLTAAVQDEDSETEEQSDDTETAEENAEEKILNMKVQIGDSVFTATLEENEAVNSNEDVRVTFKDGTEIQA